MKLLVRNLARSTTETELLAMFEACGVVQSCSLVLDAETKTKSAWPLVNKL